MGCGLRGDRKRPVRPGGVLDRQQRQRCAQLARGVERRGLVERERADRGAPQAGEMPNAVQGRAHIRGQDTDVHPLRAGHGKAQAVRPVRFQGQGKYLNAPRGAFYLHAPAGEFVQRHAIAFQRRIHRRGLPHLAGVPPLDVIERRGIDGRHRQSARHRAGPVERVRLHAEPDGPFVRFPLGHQERGQLRARADADRQHAARKRVERAEVADLPSPQRPFQHADDVRRRGSLRLVDEQDTVESGHARSSRFSLWNRDSRWLTSSRTRS